MSRDDLYEALWEVINNTDVTFEECDGVPDSDVVFIRFKGITNPHTLFSNCGEEQR